MERCRSYTILTDLVTLQLPKIQDSLWRTQKDATTPRTKHQAASSTDRRKQYQRSSGEGNGRAPKGNLRKPLKKGIIVLFHKDGKEADKIKSYRPVTLLPTIGKVLEQILSEDSTTCSKRKTYFITTSSVFERANPLTTPSTNWLKKIQEAKNKKLHTMVISLELGDDQGTLTICNIIQFVITQTKSTSPLIQLKRLKIYLLIGRLPSKQPKAQSAGHNSRDVHKAPAQVQCSGA
ncbi:hypothetical protein AVEN_111708-1 [Araneus ventricosus]|uniref:Uncharacterized protein n=1 Tax=Araneus ventricosus TaxID=182803 RepID=A0A4Y2C7S9_ARAVE|nr:hypothetical protein AVEN_111708-1 [Araneus ventricosus]